MPSTTYAAGIADFTYAAAARRLVAGRDSRLVLASRAGSKATPPPRHRRWRAWHRVLTARTYAATYAATVRVVQHRISMTNPHSTITV